MSCDSCQINDFNLFKLNQALNYINFNASRNSNLRKIEGFLNFLKEYDPIIVTIQEINICSSLKIFSDTFQVIINIEPDSRDGIGIVTLIKKGSEYWIQSFKKMVV